MPSRAWPRSCSGPISVRNRTHSYDNSNAPRREAGSGLAYLNKKSGHSQSVMYQLRATIGSRR